MHALALVVVLLAQANTAEDLYKKMAKATEDAPSLTVEFTSRISSGVAADEGDSLTGTVRVKGGAKVRVDLTYWRRKTSIKSGLVSDGKQTVEIQGESVKDPTDALLDHGKRLMSALRSVGFAGFTLAASQLKFEKRNRNDLPDLESLTTLDQFESKGEEKVGEVTAQVIAYRAAVKGGPTFAVKLWIDPATSLPIQRTLTGEYEGGNIKVAESTTFRAAELKDEEFALPVRK
jgi:outer membrane lipoprotein-sorting protein